MLAALIGDILCRPAKYKYIIAFHNMMDALSAVTRHMIYSCAILTSLRGTVDVLVLRSNVISSTFIHEWAYHTNFNFYTHLFLNTSYPCHLSPQSSASQTRRPCRCCWGSVTQTRLAPTSVSAPSWRTSFSTPPTPLQLFLGHIQPSSRQRILTEFF